MKENRKQPAFMHPAIFIGSSVVLGILFALQDWMSMRHWDYHIGLMLLLRAWALQYLLWGTFCWLIWWRIGDRIQTAGPKWIATRILPLSIAASITEELIWVLFFKNIPVNHPYPSYWKRLAFELNAEFLTNLVIFWCAMGLFRAIGYYQRYREKEAATVQLETQLVNAKLSALRMQLNPHFLFNTMNSISSLMRIDIDAADRMLEQLGSLFRITLERGDAQLIPLCEEVEFIELYLALQNQRFVGRVRQSMKVESELLDAMVPAMILQPIVENAYAHGLSKIERDGILKIEVHRSGDIVRMSIVNSGVGLKEDPSRRGSGVGLRNIRGRLYLHYGSAYELTIREVAPDKVKVELSIPLTFCEARKEELTRFGG